MYRACWNNYLEIAKLLIERGADINLADSDGRTPLYRACWNNYLEIARLLIKGNADVNLAEKDGETPLHVACWNNNLEIAKLLIERGADINLADSDDETPLYRACLRNKLEIARLLIESNADVTAALNKANNDGNEKMVGFINKQVDERRQELKEKNQSMAAERILAYCEEHKAKVAIEHILLLKRDMGVKEKIKQERESRQIEKEQEQQKIVYSLGRPVVYTPNKSSSDICVIS